MPTLPHYPGVFRIRNESPGLPYGSSNLPDKNNSGHFKDFAPLVVQIVSPSLKKLDFFKLVSLFVNAFLHL